MTGAGRDIRGSNVYAPPISEGHPLELTLSNPPERGEGFAKRAVARFLDMVWVYLMLAVSGFAAAIVLTMLEAGGRVDTEWQSRIGDGNAQMTLASFASTIVFHTLCEGLHGATLGKFVCGLRVTNESGGTCGLKAALVRNLAFLIDGLLFGLIAYQSMERSQRKQRVGDRLAHTLVVARNSVPATHRSTLGPVGAFAAGTFAACAIETMVIVLVAL